MTARQTDSVLAVCPHCMGVNRVPAGRRDDAPQCGVCHQPLFPGLPVDLDATRFDRFTTRNDLPVVVDFWAPWCGPCRSMAPHFESAARQLAGKVQFAKVNSDEAGELSARFGIRSIPTLVLLRGGQEVRRQSGALSSAQLVQWLSAA